MTTESDEIRFHGGEAYELYPKIIKRIKLSHEGKVLDAGCGKGNLAKYLTDYNLYGCDVTENFVKQARQKNYKEVRVADIYNLPYQDGEFEEVICLGVFEYIQHPEKAMKELLRVSKGRVIINTPNCRGVGILNFFSGNFAGFIDSIVKKGMIWTDTKFHKKIASDCNLKVKTKYFSRRFESIRNLWGNLLSGDIISIYERK